MLRKILVLLCLVVAASSLGFASSDQWVQVSSGHFVVLTNSNEKQARHILDQFERMRWVFQTLFPKANTDPAQPILVFAAKNSKTFQSVEPQAYLAKGQLDLAGYFLAAPEANYILLRLDADQDHPFVTVYHEYTHLQFRDDSEWMPLWLNEGIAEFFQNTEIRDKDVLVGEPSPDDLLYLRQQSLIPLPVLFKVDANSPYYHQEQKGSVFYAESWALTHYLMVNDRQKKTDSLPTYVRLMSNHEDSVVAGQEAFGDLKKLQQALESYIHDSRYMQFTLHSAAAPIDESSFTASPVTQLEADATRAQLLSLVQREKEARDLADTIIKTDPGNVRAREVMGNLAFRAGDHETARKWFGEAVKLDSKSYLANYYYAVMSLEGANPDQDQTVESSLRTAIQLNPKYAPAYDTLASVEARQHDKLVDAFHLEESAIKLDRGNLYYRLNAANILGMIGQTQDAIAILKGATGLARTPVESAMVQSRIAQIESFQQARAQQEKDRADYEAASRASAQQSTQAIPIGTALKHPSEANGPKHSVIGVIHEVTCGYPTVIEFRVESAKAAVKVYSNDFSKITLTAVGFTPNGAVNPCSDFDGMKARVQYAETTDKTVDGQIFAVELRK